MSAWQIYDGRVAIDSQSNAFIVRIYNSTDWLFIHREIIKRLKYKGALIRLRSPCIRLMEFAKLRWLAVTPTVVRYTNHVIHAIFATSLLRNTEKWVRRTFNTQEQ